jgi:hypothetical protein
VHSPVFDDGALAEGIQAIDSAIDIFILVILDKICNHLTILTKLKIKASNSFLVLQKNAHICMSGLLK